MAALGLDIGYSNLKVSVLRNDGTTQSMAVPAGAGPSSERSTNLLAPGKPGVKVWLDNTEFKTCIDQSEFPSRVRQLSNDYSRSDSYKALFYAALSLHGDAVIDHLVTGLPVEIYRDPKEREHLVSLMTGRHQITPDVSVAVKSVEVIPQPLGSFLTAIAEAEEAKDSFGQETILVVDPGFYSCDFALISKGGLVKSVCGNNCYAMSVFIENLKKSIESTNAGLVPEAILEEVIRNKEDSIYIRGEKTPLKPMINSARASVTEYSIKDISNRMRTSGLEASRVIVTGGGAELWLPSIHESFPKADVVDLKDPVTANSYGFLQHARAALENVA